MSQHSNQAGKTPTSSRKEIRGSNRTYVTSVQEQSRKADAEVGGKAKAGKKQESGAKNPVGITEVKERPAGYGSGHYTPAK